MMNAIIVSNKVMNAIIVSNKKNEGYCIVSSRKSHKSYKSLNIAYFEKSSCLVVQLDEFYCVDWALVGACGGIDW